MKNRRRHVRSAFEISQLNFFNGIFTAIIFSSFIYLEALDASYLIINSAIALYAFYRLLTDTQTSLLIAGFFIGILWFYWIPLSFRFYDMSWLIPFAIIGFGLSYSLIFWLIGFASNPLIRLPLIFSLSYIEPFYFTWFKPELLFVNTFFGVEKWQFGLILTALALMVTLNQKRFRLFPVFLLVAAFPFEKPTPRPVPFNVTLGQTAINQHQKWQPQYRQKMVDLNMNIIYKAIEDKKDLVVLPESNFPLYINLFPNLEKQLKLLSMRITIITGGLYAEGNDHYNATYHFEKGKMAVARKMILVPFGEYIPLPSYFRDWINDLFFKGGQEYLTADAPTDFMVNGVKVRNAICYEGTCEIFYKDRPDFVLVTSNNAWFAPSIEPILQRQLMKLYAKRYHVTVLHSANHSKSEILDH